MTNCGKQLAVRKRECCKKVVAQRSQSWSRDRLLASRALSSQLEQIGNTPFTELQTTYSNKTFTTAACTGCSTYNPRAPVVQTQVAVLAAERVGVTLTATWTDDTGQRSLQLYQEFGE